MCEARRQRSKVDGTRPGGGEMGWRSAKPEGEWQGSVGAPWHRRHLSSGHIDNLPPVEDDTTLATEHHARVD